MEIKSFSPPPPLIIVRLWAVLSPAASPPPKKKKPTLFFLFFLRRRSWALSQNNDFFLSFPSITVKIGFFLHPLFPKQGRMLFISASRLLYLVLIPFLFFPLAQNKSAGREFSEVSPYFFFFPLPAKRFVLRLFS